MNVVLPKYSNWKLLSIASINLSLQGFDWILAGGYALELFYGKSYRLHEDIDILIKRKHQKQLLTYFPKYRLYIAYKGNLTPFSIGEFYEKPIQDIWVLSKDRLSWCLQIMLVDEVDGNWVYKRNSIIQLPFKDIYFEKEGTKVLKPEIQLLYKSKSIRAKDQLDFEKVITKLPITAEEWLKDSLSSCYNGKHKWLN